MADNKTRKLTPKEQRRLEKISKIISHKEAEGYKRTDLTISIVKANVVATVACVVLIALSSVLYSIIYGDYIANYSWKLILFLFISFAIHEFIHGFFWGIFASEHAKSIEFGFIVKMFTPYCTCLEPLGKWQYLIGCVMPGVILGLFPYITAFIIGNTSMLFYGVVMLVGAAGDTMIMYKLLRFKSEAKDVIFMDHPTECGLIVLEKINE
ncbi:MAG: DUF3267 domain-containing protein [Clostridia bacterium]|nr:DUF3267 domain-containing protein [Clostridia bacterium]